MKHCAFHMRKIFKFLKMKILPKFLCSCCGEGSENLKVKITKNLSYPRLTLSYHQLIHSCWDVFQIYKWTLSNTNMVKFCWSKLKLLLIHAFTGIHRKRDAKYKFIKKNTKKTPYSAAFSVVEWQSTPCVCPSWLSSGPCLWWPSLSMFQKLIFSLSQFSENLKELGFSIWQRLKSTSRFRGKGSRNSKIAWRTIWKLPLGRIFIYHDHVHRVSVMNGHDLNDRMNDLQLNVHELNDHELNGRRRGDLRG